MASDLSTYLGNKVVRWLAAQAMPSAPASCYIALFNGDPKGAGSEVTTTIRVAGRVAVGFETPPASGTDNNITTSTDSDFGAAAGAATVTHVAIYDAQSAGNILCSKALASSVAVTVGETVKVLAGDLTFTVGS